MNTAASISSPVTDSYYEPGRFLADRAIRKLVHSGAIRTTHSDALKAIEPASLDLRPIGVQYRLPSAFLPMAGQTVLSEINRLAASSPPLDTPITPDDPDVALIKLDLNLDLPPDVKAVFSPKSSIGRLDLHVRVIVDGHPRFDETPYGYKGPVYAEIRSWSFPILIKSGLPLLGIHRIGQAITQLRLLSQGKDENESLIRTQILTLGFGEDFAGYTPARPDQAEPIVLSPDTRLETSRYWNKIPFANGKREITLPRNKFLIAASREDLSVPHDQCAILRTIDTSIAEGRCHSAGFVDAGFGKPHPTRLVFEIRNYGHDFILKEGQPLGVLEYHRLDRPAETPYGAGRSSYQGQGIRLSRMFV